MAYLQTQWLLLESCALIVVTSALVSSTQRMYTLCQHLCEHLFWGSQSSRCLSRSFLAEVPSAFSQRVQKLLSYMMTVHDGGGVPFLLPALLQVLQPTEDADAESQAAWLHALMEHEVRMLLRYDDGVRLTFLSTRRPVPVQSRFQLASATNVLLSAQSESHYRR